jgi:uncharacterized membrane protein
VDLTEGAMTLEAVLRVTHIAAGLLGLLVGAIGMWVGKGTRAHPLLGECYFVTITVVCSSAALIAVAQWHRLWYFLPFAVGTYAFAVVGYAAGKMRGTRWLVVHAVGLSSSYCGLAMAFLVTNARVVPPLARIPFFARLLPLMFASTCLVTWLGAQVVRGKRPAPWQKAAS